MLKEFAFTPSIFDESAHEDKEAWRDQLRELASTMFPRTSAWPVVVSDLYAGAWFVQVRSYVENITDHKAKTICINLLKMIEQILVVRPPCGDWPHEIDTAWCREAIATSASEQIDRIVSVRSTKESSSEEFAAVRCIDEVQDGGFWRGIDSDASPRMMIAEQVDLLRKMCLHSRWVAYINPYGFGTERDFALHLLDVALLRDARFGPLHFELHAEAPDVTNQVEKELRQQKVTNDMVRLISPKVTGSNCVELYFWPKLLDRIIVAGTYVKNSSGTQRKHPRWGVSMSHVARSTDPDALPTEWKLLRKERLDVWFRHFVAEDALNKPIPYRVGTPTSI